MKSTTSIRYDPLLTQNLQFSALFKLTPQNGNLVYEYNPFRNYRLSENSYYYKGRLFSSEELRQELGVDQKQWDEAINGTTTKPPIKDWSSTGWIPESEDDPVLLESGELTDFETNELSFDLNHPVDILPQYSYDGSVNLIINDGVNQPRLINSRFSPIGRNRYEIVDRKGDNDTNIYDQGEQFDVNTSLYKRTTTIAKLQFTGVNYSGNLPIGNYNFYFKYEDADGNQTDYISESGLVSIFIGNDPYNIYSGFRNQNSYKGCSFYLSNLDPSYQYISVYYTRNTSDINQNSITEARKINQKYLINNANSCNVLITGFEDTTEITLEEINPNYQVVQDAATQDQCQNMLFLANVHKPNIPYTELQDISLRFIPSLQMESYNVRDKITKEYTLTDKDNYYNPKFIYDKVGYWPDEIYRFGIVYILSDNTLSPVFNVRGGDLDQNTTFNIYKFYNGEGTDNQTSDRQYISFDEKTFLLNGSSAIKSGDVQLENSKGVVHLTASNNNNIIGIKFSLESTEDSSHIQGIINSLKKLKIKGFFFVRQKRMPTTLCQAFTIGIDRNSHVPAIPIQDGELTKYCVEQLLNSDREISHDLSLYKIDSGSVDYAAICPEYDINYPYFNSIFCGDTFKLKKIGDSHLEIDPTNERHFIMSQTSDQISNLENTTRIIAVEDNVKLVGLEDKMFSARAGEAEEGYRYEYIGYENSTKNATNIVRGSYGPYLGFTGTLSFPHSVVDIKIPEYSSANMQNYFLIRYQDKSSYYAISDRYSLQELVTNYETYDNVQYTCYRGDCFICQFTHRVNRNFSDPSAPTNDKIVDKDCWKDHYSVDDGVVNTENFDEINLGDLNAKKMGLWVTVQIRSSRNLCIRSLDDSIPDEISLYGQARAFYPYQPMRTEGSFKMPEALCYNDGFSKGLSERYNFEVPDVPYIKNEFSNRILYSDIHVNDAFTNGFRTFQGTHYRDYPKTYGSITKIIEFRGTLMCIFEHGIAQIPVNERAVAGEGAGGTVYINTSNVLPENPKIISDKYGSQWKESIIKTPYGIYGVDTISKKIWRTNGESFECISDFIVQKFLNNSITLTERELDPIIGVRNVKTHYNEFKQDVMFTFYDNLYGFQDTAWNLCYNEGLQKWITFYSWIPSYSENIYNQYFSFNRDTSKYIAKLGVSQANNSFSDGVVLDSTVITQSSDPVIYKYREFNGQSIPVYLGYDQYGNYTTTEKEEEAIHTWYTHLSLANRVMPTGNNISYSINYTIQRDNQQNHKLFDIPKGTNILIFKGTYNTITSEFYERNEDGSIKTDDRGRRIWLDKDSQVNPDRMVIQLNIKAQIVIEITKEDGSSVSLEEAYQSGYVNKSVADATYYESSVTLVPKYNMQFLTTDFWKHGQAGSIDITEKVYPTYWYGKRHPFEFEFIVADNPQSHKIFDNLQIISNSAEPESFHYEIVGDCYNFAEDKKNMYIRQEATKELYQYNGSDVSYDDTYSDLQSVHRPLGDSTTLYDRSTIMPLYYSRQDSPNSIEDYYHLKDGLPTKDFSALSGGEIVRYKDQDEYRIWNHSKGVDMNTGGRLRGNMQYNEDTWLVQINPINIVYKNEKEWNQGDLLRRQNLNKDKIPIELGQSPIPKEVLTSGDITYDPNNPNKNTIPENSMDRAIVSWGTTDSQNDEVKVKDKWIKIRIRYTGDKLAVITAVKTLYSISYA